MDPEKLSQVKGGFEIALLAGCTSDVCKKNTKTEKDVLCDTTDACRSGAGVQVPTTRPDDTVGGPCNSRQNG